LAFSFKFLVLLLMCTEIEAKLKVDSLQEIKSRLAELGAEFLEEQLQTDYFFDEADKPLIKADKCLRLRRQQTGDGVKFLLTYKGARKKSRFKKKEEIEIELRDVASTESILSALGWKRVLVFGKKRQLWRLGECEVALDELPSLGTFVEIEGPNDRKIAEVQKNLGLSDLPHIPESYPALMEKKLR